MGEDGNDDAELERLIKKEFCALATGWYTEQLAGRVKEWNLNM